MCTFGNALEARQCSMCKTKRAPASAQPGKVVVVDLVSEEAGGRKRSASGVPLDACVGVVPGSGERTPNRENSQRQEAAAPAAPTPAPGLRASTRERRSRVVLVEGHEVLRDNNYRLVGGSYVSGVVDEEAEAMRHAAKAMRLAAAAAAPPRASVARPASQPNAAELARVGAKRRLDADALASARCRERALAREVHRLRPFISARLAAQLDAVRAALPPGAEQQDQWIPIVAQPGLLDAACDMRDYQLAGLNWMARQHVRGLSMILGDEMGLGKSLQTISLLCYLKETLQQGGPSLVVAPLSVFSSWLGELQRWAPSLTVQPLHASNIEAREQLRLAFTSNAQNIDVVVTTYEMVKNPSLKSMWQRQHFRLVVLDEGHIVKNEETDVWKALAGLHRHNTVVLTGTPLQNDLHELWAVLHLMLPSVFESSEPFDRAFSASAGLANAGMMDAAHGLLKIFMLRRLKDEVEKLMPPKLEVEVVCPLSAMQLRAYRALLLKDISLLASEGGAEAGDAPPGSSAVSGSAAAAAAGSAAASAAPAPVIEVDCEEEQEQAQGQDRDGQPGDGAYKRLSNLVMQLRKCCNHPFLFRKPDATVEDRPWECSPLATTPLARLVSASGKLAVLDRLLIELRAKGHKCVIFSQFTRTLDILEEYLRLRELRSLRLDGSCSRAHRQCSINRFNNPASPEVVMLMTTRAGGMGINLQAGADTVILFDSDWNPAADLQAQARVHRIGQTRIVHVYRLVCKGTIEERMLDRCKKKLYLTARVTRDGLAGADAAAAADAPDTLGSNDLLDALRFGSNAVFGEGCEERQQLPTREALRGLISRDAQQAQQKQQKQPKKQQQQRKQKQLPQELQQLQQPEPQQPLQHHTHTVGSFDVERSVASSHMLGAVDFAAVRRRALEAKAAAMSRQARGLADAWMPATIGTADGKRARKNRVVMLEGRGSGYGSRFVPVLTSNVYDLETGEPSVFESELRAAAEQPERRAEPKAPAPDPEWNDHCQSCGVVGGDMLLCDYCACTLHRECAGFKHGQALPNKWACPQHRCTTCDQTKSRVGSLLYCCQSCTNTFCEGCLAALETSPTIIGELARLERNGWAHDPAVCYISCSRECEQYAREVLGWHERELDPKPPVPLDVSFAFGVKDDTRDPSIWA